MKLVLSGIATTQYTEKTVEINGKPMPHLLGVMRTSEGFLPITIWGGIKGKNWKEFAASAEPVSIVVEMFAKPQTYTNYEGETVTVPNLQLKLYSYLNLPSQKARPHADAVDPTGSFSYMTKEQKEEVMKPLAYDSFIAGSTELIPPPPPTVGKLNREQVQAWKTYRDQKG